MVPKSPEATMGWLFGIGVGVGLGQLLISRDKLTWRLAIGRALCSGFLAAASASVLLFYPNMPLEAQLGLGAAFASLGTTGLESLLKRVVSR